MRILPRKAQKRVSHDADEVVKWALRAQLPRFVRGYVNRARQMAVCCCLHTKGDGITADYIPPPVMSDPDQKPKDGGS